MNGTDESGAPGPPERAGFQPPRLDRAGFERRAFADQLSIETPEQVALEYPVAGIGSRFVALLLDHLIQFGALIGFGLVFGLAESAIGSRLVETLASKWLIAGFIFLFFLLYWGYFALFEAFWRGQTPGKHVMKLRVIKDAGRQITLFESLARNLLRVVDFLPSFYLAGVITMLANRRNKRLGDLAAGTLVIHERVEDQPLLYAGPGARSTVSLFPSPAPVGEPWRPAAAVQTGLFPPDAVARLSGQDLIVLEAFFARALDLPLEVRAAMAYRITGQLCARMGVPVPEGNPERMMEAAAAALRAQGRRL